MTMTKLFSTAVIKNKFLFLKTNKTMIMIENKKGIEIERLFGIIFHTVIPLLPNSVSNF